MTFDVRVVDSLCQTNIAGSFTKAGFAAADAEKRKARKYSFLVDRGYLFVPIAFETSQEQLSEQGGWPWPPQYPTFCSCVRTASVTLLALGVRPGSLQLHAAPVRVVSNLQFASSWIGAGKHFPGPRSSTLSV